MKRSVLHAWDLADPRHTYACGVEPEQRGGGIAAIILHSRTLYRWRPPRDVCRNCRRVVRARLGRGPRT